MRHNYKCRIVWKIEGGVAVKYRYGLVIVLVLVVAGIAAAQTVPSDKTMLIKLERTAVRTAPSFASPVLVFAAYRTPFAVIRTENDWVFGYVQGSSVPGYVHVSALSPVKLSLSADAVSEPPALQESEIVLAGKGFSSSLETALKEGNAFNFDAVDDMVKLTYSYAECLAFIQGTDISPGEL
jgi:hypothetical protein